MSENDARSVEGRRPVQSVRAQLLATEHWSLLASRSTAQGEVLTRISIFLTLVSAGLVSLALIGQATRFSDRFVISAIVVLGFIWLVGVLTEVRVNAVAMEDLMYVLAMNRLRAAYTELDAGIAPYLMSSVHDDMAGSRVTYDFLGIRRPFAHVAGSSMIFMSAVNAAILGLLVAGIASVLAAPVPLILVIGIALGVAYLVAASVYGARRYFRMWRTYRPYNPSRSWSPSR